jgi:small ligand-binding sensory domain FIST
MKWASAISEAPSLAAAVDEAAERVRAELGGARADLVVAFVAREYEAGYPDVPRQIAAHFPGALLVGCSAGGVIGAGREVEERGALSLTVASLPGVSLAPFAVEDMAGEAEGEGEACADEVAGWHRRVGVAAEAQPHFIVLVDPFTCDADALAGGLDAAYPEGRKVGGLASGGRFPGGNALFLGERVLRAGAVGLALSGNVAVETIVAQGCRPVGAPLVITRCEDNLILELGGRPPIDVVRALYESLDERDRELCRHSLFLGIEMKGDQLEFHAGDFLIRNLLGMDHETGALAVGALPRLYQAVQFHLRDARTAAEDLTALLDRYRREHEAPPRGALLFSCLGRGRHLYGRADHDTGLFAELVGRVPLGGFFCNGEIGPVGGTTFVHGYTSSFGLFREKAS